MVDFSRLGSALSGFSAGVSGDLPAFRQQRSNETERLRLRAEQKRTRRGELSEGRKRAAAEDFRTIRDLAAGGFTDRAISTINKRLQVGRLLPQFDSSSSDFVKNLLEGGETDRAIEFLDLAEDVAVRNGFIDARPTPDLQVVPASSSVIDPANPSEAIFTAPDKPSTAARSQISGTFQVKDTEGNLFNVATVFNPATGKTEDSLTPLSGVDSPVGKIQMVDSSGRTTQERIEESGLSASTARAAVVAIDAGKDAFEALSGVESQISTLDDAVELLRVEGVDTGPILNRLPTFRSAAIELENVQARLGLNIIQNTTFGSLSEAELRFALDTALPTALQPEELIDWIERKQSAQRKLTSHLRLAASFLGTPGNTIPKWLEFQKQGQILKAISSEEDQAANEGLPSITTQEEFDALEPGSAFLEDGQRKVKR